LSAVDAVMMNKTIESNVRGRINGSDVSAGFEYGWVEMDDLNLQNAPEGSEELMKTAIAEFTKGKNSFVFKGDLKGVNPDDPTDTIDLKDGYIENEKTSYPTFNYILKDIITIIE
ncbi:MAG: hypothetical protein J6Z02_09085, partial [Lachnospiraceae bacterium]|nr:hypothetical protein [Lachnospiraceae bacterium]